MHSLIWSRVWELNPNVSWLEAKHNNHYTNPAKNGAHIQNRTEISCLQDKCITIMLCGLGMRGEIRTHTWRILNPLPRPIGLHAH